MLMSVFILSAFLFFDGVCAETAPRKARITRSGRTPLGGLFGVDPLKVRSVSMGDVAESDPLLVEGGVIHNVRQRVLARTQDKRVEELEKNLVREKALRRSCEEKIAELNGLNDFLKKVITQEMQKRQLLESVLLRGEVEKSDIAWEIQEKSRAARLRASQAEQETLRGNFLVEQQRQALASRGQPFQAPTVWRRTSDTIESEIL